jgi:hypothetical protein
MPPRPLHRWKSFWLGVFVVVFLGWAWVRSMGYRDNVGVLWDADAFILSSGSATVAAGIGNIGEVVGRTFLTSHGASPAENWFPQYFLFREVDGEKAIEVAHWLLLLLFLLPWTTVLIWRSRRMKRLAPGSAGLPTGPNGP